MSRSIPSHARNKQPAHAALFAALGDKTRLALVARLCSGEPASITQLTAGTRITRQAITKHLRVLERTGLVRCVRAGRESRFGLDPRPLHAMQQYLDVVSHQWDQALARLKAFVED
ncbi:Transcriptional regulator, ArsR family [Candidatus Sulfotelmatomonas gaucii]|uniref:Transcriptional regulator, ArsR family n=1 Tax=Candidatus Sulfuritelmatomonas gaucii TaxID=2043161 RepID=A0A2N9L4D9_9BACT|nr:Transcriptional regulator, ArsR family [Candidatus Sulfotelmatomonas gaucii]